MILFSASLGSSGAIVAAAIWMASASSAANSDNDIVSKFAAKSSFDILSIPSFCIFFARTDLQSRISINRALKE
jgi:hypothetical protein